MLNGWISSFSRHTGQLNRPHEADAELIAMPGTGRVLALTTDTISEEIALGFYRDPYTIGWMAATVSLSDLAAVGAMPLGILVSVTLPAGTPESYQKQIAEGIEAVCRVAGTHILGGDTNTGAETSITTTAAGLADRERVLKRTGCRPGDLLYSTGRLGTGGMVAAMAFFGMTGDGAAYRFRPVARIREAQKLRPYITACMDSSDGLIATLDQLMRLNGAGFELTLPPETMLDPDVIRYCRDHGFDPLLMLAQPHGEFELIFTIRAADRERFEEYARTAEAAFLFLGKVILEPEIRLLQPVRRVIDSAAIRNLLSRVDGDNRRYAEELIALIHRS
jgi:thiamine-monophosphate kinase